MTIRLDEQGRIALPASVREDLGFLPGDEIELLKTVDGIELRSASANRVPRLVMDRGLLVYRADEPLPPGFDLERFIAAERDGHSDRVARTNDDHAG